MVLLLRISISISSTGSGQTYKYSVAEPAAGGRDVSCWVGRARLQYAKRGSQVSCIVVWWTERGQQQIYFCSSMC